MGVWAHLVRGVHESLTLVPASEPPGDERLTSSLCALRVTFDPRGCVGHEHGETLPQKQAESDRKSTRLNSSHGYISYAVFCLKKKKTAQEGSTAHDHSS